MIIAFELYWIPCIETFFSANILTLYAYQLHAKFGKLQIWIVSVGQFYSNEGWIETRLNNLMNSLNIVGVVIRNVCVIVDGITNHDS